MKRIGIPLVAVLALFVACQDNPLLAPDGPATALQDGSTGGNAHFYFLPPLAQEPETDGDFDAGAEVGVVICEWSGDACGETMATFDTEGSGSERVRADATEEHYIVNWHTRRSGLADGGVYRIMVRAEGQELGHIDTYAVRRGRDLRTVDEAEYFPLLIGRTVPIKFRVEVGAFQVPTARVVGIVTDVSGAGLGGVETGLEGTAIFGTTNPQGGLTLEGVRTGQAAVLRLTLDGYAEQLVQVEIPTGVEQVTFRTSMLQRAAPVTVSAATGGAATSTDGASVTLTPSSLVDGSGDVVSGDVEVTVTPVDVSEEIEAFPGSFTGVNTDGESGLLLTYGVAEYTFTQGGQELNLAPGATATIRLPVYTGAAGLSVGDELPLWYLDETTGEWIEEATGTVVADAASPTGLAVEGQVSHFSWWNIDVWQDAPYEPWIRCYIDGSPVSCTIYATVDDPSFPRTNVAGYLPSDGGRLTFPASPVVTEVTGESTNRYGSVAGGVSGPSGGGSGDTIVVDLTEEGTISGDNSVVTVSPDSVAIPESVTFTLEARDSSGAPMGTGGASVLFYVYRGAALQSAALAQDNGDGTYTLAYVPPDSGTFTVRGRVNFTSVATGDPSFTATWSADAGRGATSLLSVAPTAIAVGDTATVLLQAYDSAGVPKTTGGDIVSFGTGGSGALVSQGVFGPVTDEGNGTYTAPFIGTSAGTPLGLTATVNQEPVTTGTPTIAVTPGVLTEAGADSALSEAFLAWWRSAHDYGIEFTMATMADAASSSWGNVALRFMSSEPRQAWDNDPDYGWASVTLNAWLNAYTAVSRAYDVLRSLDAGLQMNGGTDNARTRAAARLVQGLAHGQLALAFDQAFVLSESVDVSTAMLAMEPYGTVMDSALAFLQDAITVSNANTFTLPDHWIEGAPLTDAELAQVAHSYSARFMATVARTPTERVAADWTGIRSHITQGITSDFGPISDGSEWVDNFKGFVPDAFWFRADYRMIGGIAPGDPETDPTGAFAAWLAEAPADRLPFVTETADRRIWDGTVDGGGHPNPGVYFTYDPTIIFRPERGTYHFSYYVSSRLPVDYGYNAGDFLMAMSTEEMALLDAEALIQLGQPGAANLINQTRVANGGLSSATDGDADLFDKLAYEKRLETFHLNGALAFYDRRGWGADLGPTDFGQGLVDGTPHHFPVPGAELERLGIPNYTFGGAGAAFRIAGDRRGGLIQVPAAALYHRGGPVLSTTRPTPRQ